MPEPVRTEDHRSTEPRQDGVGGLLSHPAVPFAGPFAVFLLLLAAQDYLAVLGVWEAPIRFAVLAAVVFVFSRRVLDFGTSAPLASVVLGVAVFALWVAPDLVWPEMRRHWLFQNSLVSSPANSLNSKFGGDSVFLIFRVLRAVVIVPVIEELFWRGWLQRWLIHHDFRSISLGAYTRGSFWVTAALFALEHGSYWDVGLLAGIAYGWWITRTRRLGDCILAHAVTNACLSAYVIQTSQWRYWP